MPAQQLDAWFKIKIRITRLRVFEGRIRIGPTLGNSPEIGVENFDGLAASGIRQKEMRAYTPSRMEVTHTVSP